MKSKKSDIKVKIPSTPLPDRVRPKSLKEFYGQEHLVGEGKPIRLMIDNKNISPFILGSLKSLFRILHILISDAAFLVKVIIYKVPSFARFFFFERFYEKKYFEIRPYKLVEILKTLIFLSAGPIKG